MPRGNPAAAALGTGANGGNNLSDSDWLESLLENLETALDDGELTAPDDTDRLESRQETIDEVIDDGGTTLFGRVERIVDNGAERLQDVVDGDVSDDDRAYSFVERLQEALSDLIDEKSDDYTDDALADLETAEEALAEVVDDGSYDSDSEADYLETAIEALEAVGGATYQVISDARLAELQTESDNITTLIDDGSFTFDTAATEAIEAFYDLVSDAVDAGEVEDTDAFRDAVDDISDEIGNSLTHLLMRGSGSSDTTGAELLA